MKSLVIGAHQNYISLHDAEEKLLFWLTVHTASIIFLSQMLEAYLEHLATKSGRNCVILSAVQSEMIFGDIPINDDLRRVMKVKINERV